MVEVGLRGHYRIRNASRIQEKSIRDDPRNKFYKAMLESSTYEAYLAVVGQIEVTVDSYKDGPINGRMEILYARRRGWIEDGR